MAAATTTKATTTQGTAVKATGAGITDRTIACTVAGCKRPYRAKGYCNVHYRKWRRGELETKPRYKICKEENCRKPLYRKGYCEQHYSAWSASKKGAAAAAVPAAETKPAEPATEASAGKEASQA